MDVRADLLDVHREAWASLGSPGTWWTGVQGRELANTALAALTTREPIPPWGSASGTPGVVSQSPTAPATSHDAVYRIARHAGTLTESWYESIVDELGPLPYIEVVGIACIVATVNAFRRAAGLTAWELPDAADGEPTQAIPDDVEQARLTWVPVRAPADERSAVWQAFSAVPKTFDMNWKMASAQYIPVDQMIDPAWSRGTLSRPQIELVAMKTAQARECFY